MTVNLNIQKADNIFYGSSINSAFYDSSIRERVLAAFDFQEVRPTPYTVWYDHETKNKLDRYYGSSEWQNTIHDHILRITVEWRPRTNLDNETFRDVNGSVWKYGNSPHLIKPALDKPSVKGYEIPSYRQFLLQATAVPGPKQYKGRYGLSFSESQQLLDQLSETAYSEVDYGYGLLESAWMIRGFQQFYMDLVLHPQFAHDLLDMVLERQLEVVDIIAALRCDGIMVTDDYGNQQGLSISPQLWRTFVKPRLAKIYDRIHAAGKTVFHHSCGNLQEVIPEMLDIGLDVLQSVQPEAMDVYELKRKFGNNLCLWGGLGTQQLLPFGDPEQIKNEIRKLKKYVGKNGGYVFSSCKPLMGEVPLENVIALIEESTAEDS